LGFPHLGLLLCTLHFFVDRFPCRIVNFELTRPVSALWLADTLLWHVRYHTCVRQHSLFVSYCSSV